MKSLKGQFLVLFVFLCGALSLQGMFSSRMTKAMQQKRKQLQSKYQYGQQKMGYSGTTGQQGPSLWGWVTSFFKSKPVVSTTEQQLPKFIEQKLFFTTTVPAQEQSIRQEEPSSVVQKEFFMQQEPFMQQEEDTTRRDEMFAFMDKELEVAKKYYTLLMGKELSRILNELYEYKDILNQEKDGHTILGEIIPLYGFYLKDGIDKAELFRPLMLHRAETILNFFREVKKLGANNMTPDDFREIEKIKNEFISFLIAYYSEAEELISFGDLLNMADALRELKGEELFFVSKVKELYSWWEFADFISIEFSYRGGNLSWNKAKNTEIYNDLIQLLKEAVASIFGLNSEFYQNFVNRWQKVHSYTDDEINEIKNMRDMIKKELVGKKQKKLWQEWQERRKQQQVEKEQRQQYEKLQQELMYKKEQELKATYKKGQAARDEEQIKREQQAEQQKKEEERKKREREEQERQEQQRKYQQEQQRWEEQRQERQRAEQQKREEEREQREREEQEKQQRRSPEELKILMTLARGEYIKKLKEYTSNILDKLSISSTYSDKELDVVYKGLIKELHPDVKGNKVKAQLLNAARSEYMQLKKEFERSSSRNKDQSSRE